MPPRRIDIPDDIFKNPEKASEQDLIDAILEATIYDDADRERLRMDPLVRLLIRNPPGHYDFLIVSAAGVVTEGKKGNFTSRDFDDSFLVGFNGLCLRVCASTKFARTGTQRYV